MNLSAPGEIYEICAKGKPVPRREAIDTSIFLTLNDAAGNPTDTNVFVRGSDPIMGSVVQIAHLFPLSSYSNVAVWQGSVNGETHIFGRPFVVDIPDEVKENPGGVPSFRLYQNYPNPFNPATEINYSVPRNGFLTLKVYNVLGQEVATLFSGMRIPGRYQATFNASRFASGVYFYRLQAGGYSVTKKMLLLK